MTKRLTCDCLLMHLIIKDIHNNFKEITIQPKWSWDMNCVQNVCTNSTALNRGQTAGPRSAIFDVYVRPQGRLGKGSSADSSSSKLNFENCAVLCCWSRTPSSGTRLNVCKRILKTKSSKMLSSGFAVKHRVSSLWIFWTQHRIWREKTSACFNWQIFI